STPWGNSSCGAWPRRWPRRPRRHPRGSARWRRADDVRGRAARGVRRPRRAASVPADPGVRRRWSGRVAACGSAREGGARGVDLRGSDRRVVEFDAGAAAAIEARAVVEGAGPGLGDELEDPPREVAVPKDVDAEAPTRQLPPAEDTTTNLVQLAAPMPPAVHTGEVWAGTLREQEGEAEGEEKARHRGPRDAAGHGRGGDHRRSCVDETQHRRDGDRGTGAKRDGNEPGGGEERCSPDAGGGCKRLE